MPTKMPELCPVCELGKQDCRTCYTKIIKELEQQLAKARELLEHEQDIHTTEQTRQQEKIAALKNLMGIQTKNISDRMAENFKLENDLAAIKEICNKWQNKDVWNAPFRKAILEVLKMQLFEGDVTIDVKSLVDSHDKLARENADLREKLDEPIEITLKQLTDVCEDCEYSLKEKLAGLDLIIKRVNDWIKLWRDGKSANSTLRSINDLLTMEALKDD